MKQLNIELVASEQTGCEAWMHEMQGKMTNAYLGALFSAEAPDGAGPAADFDHCQNGNFLTVRRQVPIYFHPPHLKILKRDGVFIFESKRKSNGVSAARSSPG